MNDFEALSRLAAGELSDEDTAALRQRIDADPDLKSAWESLQGLDEDFAALFSQPPPPDLDEQILRENPPGNRAFPRFLQIVPWAMAAALLLAVLAPKSTPEHVLSAGTELVQGRQDVAVGDVLIEVDGVAEISVEPIRPVSRVTWKGGEMQRQKQLIAAGMGALITVAVYQGKAVVYAASGDTTEVKAGEQLEVGKARARRAAPTPVALDEDPGPPGLQSEIDILKAEKAVLEKLLADMQVEFKGTPISWTDDIPELLRPEAFKANVEEAIDDCEPDVELVGFDCTEPPCFAILRPDSADWWDGLVNSCPAWTDNYTSSVASASFNAVCADGSEERVQMLGWSSHLLPDEGTAEDKENRNKRFSARIDETKLGWTCRSE